MLTSATGKELTSAHHATETYSHASDIFLGLSLRSWYEFCFTLSKDVFSLGGLFKDILGLPPQPTLQTISKFGESDRHSVALHWCTWIWTNTFCNLCNKNCNFGIYILQIGQIHFARSANTFQNVEKYIFDFQNLGVWQAVCGPPLMRLN